MCFKFAFFLFGAIIWGHVSTTVVSVEQGLLKGEKKETITGNKCYYSFKGIPYAAPPTGTRRFKAPQPPRKWKGIRNATEHGNVCPQFNLLLNKFVGKEDCLFLNVYTPTLSTDLHLSVIFYIHLGGYAFGYGNDDFYGPDFLIDQNDVVVVTFNHRVDNLGFLCLDTADVPGNAGMKDQVAALKWVRRNIKNFGGDPKKITIGQSVGGASATLHALSPMSKGLFRRVFASSGVPISEFSISFEQRRRAFALGKQLGFETTNATLLLKFLQKVPVRQLLYTNSSIIAAEDYVQPALKLFLTAPVVEKDFGQERFLTEHPLISVQNGRSEADMLLGFNSNEGIISLLFENTSMIEDYKRFPEVLVPRDVLYQTSPEIQLELADLIREYYTGSPLKSLNTFPLFVRYTTAVYIYPIIRYARRLAQVKGNGNVYLFQFSTISERNVFSQLGTKYGITGVSHIDEHMYIFNANFYNLPVIKNSTSYRTIQRMCSLITNFAIFGDPTPDSAIGLIWPTYDKRNEVYLNIGEDLTLREHPRASLMDFWESLYKKLHYSFNL